MAMTVSDGALPSAGRSIIQTVKLSISPISLSPEIGETTKQGKHMDERQQRLRELNEIITSRRRYDPPPGTENERWVAAYEDREEGQGNTILRGIPVWYPKAETEEWHRLRFGVEMAEPVARRLTSVEVDELRRDMAEASIWARTELRKRRAAKK